MTVLEGEGRMADWQPIETAPKDRTILVYGKPEPLIIDGQQLVTFHKPAVYSAAWDSVDDAFVVSGGSWLGPFVTPTHWQALPAPPAPPTN